VRDLQPPKDHQVVLLTNPKFDKELGGTAQAAKSDLPTESSGVLRGVEKREIADLSFIDLAGRYGKKWSRRASNAEKVSVSWRQDRRKPRKAHCFKGCMI
jgi:hypothetical protein